MEMRKGILIVDHGSRSMEAIWEFNEVVKMLQEKHDDTKLIGAHMEINEPNIPDAIDEFLLAGIFEITVVPYFLFMGKHIKNDIPDILRNKKRSHPELIINYTRPVGINPLLAEILSQRVDGPHWIQI